MATRKSTAVRAKDQARNSSAAAANADERQPLKPSLIITQSMLRSLYVPEPTLSDPAMEELAVAILAGCRIEPGPIKPSLETDWQGYQRFHLSKE